MNLKKWPELEPGVKNLEAGSAVKNLTGVLRRGFKPIFKPEHCINCFFCWVFCPENAIIIKNEKVVGINYDYCKGCGICENECPVQKKPVPLVMVEEEKELW